MKKLGDLLNSRNIEQKLSKEESKKKLLETGWQTCMGKACSSHTNRLNVRNGILTVFMDSQVWQQEIMFAERKKIVSEMTRETGLNIVDVKIKTGG